MASPIALLTRRRLLEPRQGGSDRLRGCLVVDTAPRGPQRIFSELTWGNVLADRRETAAHL
jgi:hypothetical protein